MKHGTTKQGKPQEASQQNPKQAVADKLIADLRSMQRFGSLEVRKAALEWEERITKQLEPAAA
jgi:hypothetical protein